MARDLYETLGVSRTADDDAIKKAFRKLAAKYHPDKNPGKENEQRFKEINQAHEVLGDKEKRALYDEFGEDSLRSGFDAEQARMMRNFARRGGGGGGRTRSVNFQDIFGGGGGGADFGDLFGDVFARQQGRRPRKGADMQAEVAIDFVSAIKGTTVQLSRAGQEEVTVRIPPGVQDGGRLRIPGEGGQVPGGEPGDLLLTVKVGPHPYFRREGDDLHLDLPITISEAFKGGKVRIPTPDGDVHFRIRPRTQGGAVTRLKGTGVSRKGKPPGHLFVKFQITIPDTESPEVTAAVDAIAPHEKDPRDGIRL